ncbi:unnamed protein product [Spirodela intermedia]|uniref:Uncharacterized protein n=1 Tax=Spirodela intermedia TaxID=51605 RepID=A0A7I8LLJ9_SPIIN|nr:unnamed protein product [Spirodela intermedia]
MERTGGSGGELPRRRGAALKVQISG